MSDEEIKKALKQQIRIANYVDSSYCDSVGVDLLQKTIDTINRLELENENLKDEKNQLENELCNERMNLNHMTELCDSNEDTILKLQDSLERANKYGRQADEENARLKAEIEKLNSLCVSLENDVDVKLKYIYELEAKLEAFKSEAIKEFAKRLKEDCPDNLLVIHFDAIDKLVKEMVGENNDKM